MGEDSVYEPRFYRDKNTNNRLKSFNVTYKDTDLLVLAPVKLTDICFTFVRNLRKRLEYYLGENPLFLTSLKPVEVDSNAPQEAIEMSFFSARVGVGPMASVAGLFAEKVGQKVLEFTDEVIVENGGDIFLSVNEDCRIGIFAGEDSPFKDKLAFKISARQTPLGICTSSGKMGPSLNLGKADSVTVISPSTILADAAATAISNRVQTVEDISKAIEWAKGLEGIQGVVIIKEDKIGVWGDIEIIIR